MNEENNEDNTIRDKGGLKANLQVASQGMFTNKHKRHDEENHVEPISNPGQNEADEGWSTTIRRKKTRSDKSFSGTGNQLLPVAERTSYNWIFVSRLDASVSAEGLKLFLKNAVEADFIVEKLKPKVSDAKYASFKVGVPRSVKEKVIKPEFWPKQVFINKFYFSKNYKENFRKGVQPITPN